jgi:hypothetical protein
MTILGNAIFKEQPPILAEIHAGYTGFSVKNVTISFGNLKNLFFYVLSLNS